MKREELVQLYVKPELIGRGHAPTLNHSLVRDRVERRIKLDHLKMLRVPRQPFVRRHLFRIPARDKTGIGPTRRADENFTAASFRRLRFGHTLTKSFAGVTQLVRADRRN